VKQAPFVEEKHVLVLKNEAIVPFKLLKCPEINELIKNYFVIYTVFSIPSGANISETENIILEIEGYGIQKGYGVEIREKVN
jgi:hypothetical protein